MRWLERFARARSEPEPTSVAEQMAAALDARRSAATTRRALAIWGPLAHAGVARAQNNIGACFAEGLGVERDPALAARWLGLAAEPAIRSASATSPPLYFRGEGVAAGLRPRAALYRAAAEAGRRAGAGHAELDAARRRGRRRRSSPRRARLGAPAAEQGIAASMTRLGMIYHQALGVERDPAEAARLVAHGCRARRRRRRRRCSAPPFISAPALRRDPVAALAWLTRREQRRQSPSPNASSRPRVAASTPAAIAEAERRAGGASAGAARRDHRDGRPYRPRQDRRWCAR